MAITPNTVETTEEIVREVLGLNYNAFGFQKETGLIAEIVGILENEENAVKDERLGASVPSPAAGSIWELLWNRFSGGGVAAMATTELFLSLDREDELGRVREEAGGYPDYKIQRFIERLLAAREAKQNA